jgi:hypothetical protein
MNVSIAKDSVTAKAHILRSGPEILFFIVELLEWVVCPWHVSHRKRP